MSNRRALLIGIDKYDTFRPLNSCVADARRMEELLALNEDGSANYACNLLTSDDWQKITRGSMRIEWRNMFRDFSDEILFYFSGHGAPSQTGGYLATQDATAAEPGLPMSELIELANNSSAKEVLIILDCCYAGDMGEIALSHYPGASPHVQLRQGVTILGSSGRNQLSKELEAGHGVFTSLVIGALSGGGADARGRVSAASIYSYVEQALGPWDQRPIYKAYVSTLSAIRCCKPPVSDVLLRKILDLFPKPDSQHQMDPSYEFTHKSANPKNVEIFNIFKVYRNARLLRTVEGDDLYFAALDSHGVELTPLGKSYWELANNKRF